MIEEKKIILLELFSGIGGFYVGLRNAGFVFDKVYYSEIDRHAIANYKYNFKESEYVGSVVDVSGTELRARHPNEQFIITFGWPCQDNSIAGKRKGQVTGTRSFLLNEAVRLIREIQPYCFVAENVKGLYSVNDGKDFRDSLELLSYLDTDDFQYIVEHQLCNTSWLLPQNRERTYFVGYSAKRSWAGVFPITESDFGINERATETTVASITAGGHSGGHHSGMTLVRHRSTEPYEHSDLCPTIRNSDKAEVRIVAQRGREEKCLTPKLTEYGKAIRKEYEEHLKIEKRKNIQQLEPREDGLTNSLTGVQKDNMIMVGDSRSDEGFRWRKTGLAPSIRGSNEKSGSPNSGLIMVGDYRKDEGFRWRDDNNAPTLQARQRTDIYGQPVIQINPSLESGGQQPYQQNRVYDADGILPALHSLSEHTNIFLTERLSELTPYQGDKITQEDEIMPTLPASGGNNLHGIGIQTNQQIRRLTEIECERLQGYVDGFTEYGDYDGTIKKIPKTQRYKMLGNAVTTNIVELVGRRIKLKP